MYVKVFHSMLKVTCKLNANREISCHDNRFGTLVKNVNFFGGFTWKLFYFLLFSITFMILKSGTVVNRLLMEEYCTFLFSKLFVVSHAEKILRIWLNIEVESVESGEKRINVKK